MNFFKKAFNSVKKGLKSVGRVVAKAAGTVAKVAAKAAGGFVAGVAEKIVPGSGALVQGGVNGLVDAVDDSLRTTKPPGDAIAASSSAITAAPALPAPGGAPTPAAMLEVQVGGTKTVAPPSPWPWLAAAGAAAWFLLGRR